MQPVELMDATALRPALPVVAAGDEVANACPDAPRAC
jgi:hypothetical protein